MVRKYKTDPGYVTIPEANDIVRRMLRIVDKDDKTYYNKILEKAKHGAFGGKKYKKRMYQVRRKDIEQYAQELLKDQQLNLYDFEFTSNLNNVNKINNLHNIDSDTARNINSYLNYLKHFEIITEEAFQHGKRNLILLLELNKLAVNHHNSL
ncbi:hypothetical protein GCM10011351_17400 [Paraliobacillus quinghaiensis]|uniref:Uncharacterized protein n=1 Tax=Paraliobacillus quinghaiensis TaxID=470815 RepID=A0A917TPT9_9BACI|nr:hypothetical protein [Paraliobacillus quinghaiensis]GGM31715.1 hypothetical protein GCM10011351_17400 [Paraliobacillus quinghaiensis]